MVDLDSLLTRTSRTFALAIPTLPTPPRREVSVAYLLFRIADTFEDAVNWPRADRLRALAAFAELLRSPNGDLAKELATAWVVARPCEQEGYLTLLRETPAMLRELAAFTPRRREIIIRHTLRTIAGMASFVSGAREDGSLALDSEADLRRYCYVVAGIVGELLTELFLDTNPDLEAVAPALHANAVAFGEGLQLVNILKDSEVDASEGRSFIPEGVGRRRAMALARQGLAQAAAYVEALETGLAPRGIVAFTALPVLLARATLDEVEKRGAGAKASRSVVAKLVAQMNSALDRGAPSLVE